MSFETDAAIVVRALTEYYESSLSGDERVIRQPLMSELVTGLDLANLITDGDLTGDRLREFLQGYLAGVTRFHHPANIAHQQAVPHYMAALAGLVDNFVNSDGSIYEFGPASVTIEHFLVNWLLEKVGWTPAPLSSREENGPHGGGILANGGSIANLTALIAARTRIAPRVWEEGNPGDLALLAPDGAHYSIARAAGIMGLGHRAIYKLETDEWGLIRTERLADGYARAVADGKRVVALVANAATTAAGLYDSLEEIGAFCRERDLWFHVDAAHGGPALLTDKYRHLMKGVELADSLVMNMHKLMRVPPYCTALLVCDSRTLDHAFQQEASYLFHAKDQPGPDSLHRTIECTKPVLGFKFLMVLAGMGETGMKEYIERQVDLTLEAYRYLQDLPDFSCPVEPQTNILCFQVGNLGEEHLDLRARLLARGKYYVSTTELNGRRYLRLTLTNPATTMAEIRGLVREIRELVAKV